MGCDIHMVVERKIQGKWHCVWDGCICPRVNVQRDEYDNLSWESPAACARNYSFFARLAGVRGPGPDAKGVPDDVSEVTRYRITDWAQDGHSHSWDTLEDFCRKFWFESGDEESADFVKRKLLGEDDSSVRDLFGPYSDEAPENVRVVYWFDN